MSEPREETLAKIIAEHVPDLASDTKNTGLYKAILTFVESETSEAHAEACRNCWCDDDL